MRDIGKNGRANNGSWTLKEAKCRGRESNDDSKKIVTDGDKKIGHAMIGIGERIAKLGIGQARAGIGRSGKTGHARTGLDLHRKSNALRVEARTRART